MDRGAWRMKPEERARQLDHEAANLAAKVQQLKGDLAALEVRLAGKAQEESALNDRLEERRNSLDQMQAAATAQLAAAAGAVEQAQAAIQALVQREQSLQAALEKLEERWGSLQEEVAELRAARAAAGAETATVRRQVNDLEERRLALRDQVRAEEEEVRQVLAKLRDRVQAEESAARESVARLAEARAQAEAAAGAAQARAQAAEDQAAAGAKTLADMQARLADTQARQMALASEIARMEEERDELVASYRPLRPWQPAGPIKKYLTGKIKFSCQVRLIHRKALEAMLANSGLFPGYPTTLDDLVSEALRNYLPTDAFEQALEMAEREEEQGHEPAELVRQEPGRRGPGRPPKTSTQARKTEPNPIWPGSGAG